MTPLSLSQRDPRWASILLGLGSGTIGSYGCTITCISMLLGLIPDVVNQKMKDAKAFGGDTKNLVLWSQLPSAFSQIKSALRVKEYNNAAVKEAISKYGGCLVEVDGARIGASRHWVLYIGDGQMLDPWFGNQKATSYYAPIGYAILQITQESMPDELKACLADREKFWSERDQALAERDQYKNEVEAKKTEIQELRKELNTFMETLAEKLVTIADKAEIVGAVERMLSQESELQKKVSEAQKAYENLEEDKKAEITQLKKELKDVKDANSHMADQIDRLEDRLIELEVPPKPQKSLIDIITGLLEAWKGRNAK